MKIIAQIDYEHTTCSGKPSISFYCEDCHLSFCGHHIDAYFWQTNLDKANLKLSIDLFLKAIHEKNIECLFQKVKTGKKLLKALCQCDPKIVSLEYHKSFKRARKILEVALNTVE